METRNILLLIIFAVAFVVLSYPVLTLSCVAGYYCADPITCYFEDSDCLNLANVPEIGSGTACFVDLLSTAYSGSGPGDCWGPVDWYHWRYAGTDSWPSGGSEGDTCRSYWNDDCGNWSADGLWDPDDATCILNCTASNTESTAFDTRNNCGSFGPGDGACEGACGADSACDERNPDSSWECYTNQECSCDSSCNYIEDGCEADYGADLECDEKYPGDSWECYTNQECSCDSNCYYVEDGCEADYGADLACDEKYPGDSCGDGNTCSADCTCEASPPECESCYVQNLSCPSSSILIGESFTITFDFYGTGPTYPYEHRSLWRDGSRIDCNYGTDESDCVWNSDSFITTCPTTPGTYTYEVKCYGATSVNNLYCGLDDDSQSCTVTCVECDCSAWSDVGCGVSPCASTEMKQTRTCTPSGCDIEEQCVSDPSCEECDYYKDCPCPPDGCCDADGDGNNDDYCSYPDYGECVGGVCDIGTGSGEPCEPWGITYNDPDCGAVTECDDSDNTYDEMTGDFHGESYFQKGNTELKVDSDEIRRYDECNNYLELEEWYCDWGDDKNIDINCPDYPVYSGASMQCGRPDSTHWFTGDILYGTAYPDGGACAEYTTGKAMIFYAEVDYESSGGRKVGDDFPPIYRWWDGTNWSPIEWEGVSEYTFLGRRPYWIELEASPTRDEYMMGLVGGGYEAHPTVYNGYFQIFSGERWANLRTGGDAKGCCNYHKGMDVAYEQLSGDGLGVFGQDTVTLRYHVWNGTSWSGGTIDTSFINPSRVLDESHWWIELKSNPNSDEIILAAWVWVDSGEEYIIVGVWDGSSWGNFKTFQPVRYYAKPTVAYESISGRAIVAWSDETGKDIDYIIWDGSSWSDQQSALPLENSIRHVRLVSDPTSNRILLGIQDAYRYVYVNFWDGTSWGTNLRAGRSSSYPYDRRPFDVAFQRSGDGLVVWGVAGAEDSYLYYRSWTPSTGWSDPTQGPRTGTENQPADVVLLTPDPYSNEIIVAVGAGYQDWDYLLVGRYGSSFGDLIRIERFASEPEQYQSFAVAYSLVSCIRANPTVSLSPSQLGTPGETLLYTASVQNNDDPATCDPSTFSLAVSSCPSDWACSLDQNSVLISPGSTDSSVTLSVTSPLDASPGDYTISVTATNTEDTAYSGTGFATYTIPIVPTAAFSCDASECSGGVGNASCVMYQPTADLYVCLFELINDSTDPDGTIALSQWFIKEQGGTFNPMQCTPSPCSGICDCTVQPGDVPDPGNYVVQLYVEDDQGASASTTRDLLVKREVRAGFMCSLDNINWQACKNISLTSGEVIYVKDDLSLVVHSTSSEEATQIVSRVWEKGSGAGATFESEEVFAVDTTSASTTLTQDINAIRLTVRDNSPEGDGNPDGGRTDYQDETISIGAPLPEWKEVPPVSWIIKFLAGLDGFLSKFFNFLKLL